MNTQTERLDNHTARLTVEVESERLEKAKQVAAKKLAGRLNIPGFRKGKAPYKVILHYVGEAALVEDAVEELGNEVYKQVLDEADIEPYGPGQLEDIKTDSGNPTFTFVVPLQPTVELNDYRSVRRDYEPPTVTDQDVDRTMRALQEEHAVVEESHRPVALGDRITVEIDARLIDEDDNADAAETGTEADHDEDKGGPHHHVDEKTILHDHDAQISLSDEDVVAPGFAEAMKGANVGERREFDLTYPDDRDEYEELAGKRAHFNVLVKKIENVTLPALNDDLAARATADEEKPLTLLELRMRVRENLQQAQADRYKNDFARDTLTDMVERADVHYPEAMVAEQIQRFLQQLDSDLRQRRLTLEDYKRIYNKTDEDLYNDYRDNAVRAIERTLVMRAVADAERLSVSDEQLVQEIDRLAGQFGAQADAYRRLFDEPFMRQNLRNDMLSQAVMDRIADIARGAAPELSAEPEAETATETTDEGSKEQGETA